MNLSNLFKLLKPHHIKVVCESEQFVFTLEKNEIRLPTFIVIDNNQIVLAVGKEYYGTKAFKKVEFLIESDETLTFRYECYESYIKYALSELLKSKFFFLRPDVTAKLKKSFRLLNFEHKSDFLKQSFERAGVRKLIIEESD